MSDATVERLVAAGGFIEIRCCGENVAFANPNPFSREANIRFEEIRERYVSAADPFGNRWVDDLEAKALIADPKSHATPEDGERLAFGCPHCGASFVWAGGVVCRVPKESA
jgi:hypothetical protein